MVGFERICLDLNESGWISAELTVQIWVHFFMKFGWIGADAIDLNGFGWTWVDWNWFERTQGPK